MQNHGKCVCCDKLSDSDTDNNTSICCHKFRISGESTTDIVNCKVPKGIGAASPLKDKVTVTIGRPRDEETMYLIIITLLAK